MTSMQSWSKKINLGGSLFLLEALADFGDSLMSVNCWMLVTWVICIHGAIAEQERKTFRNDSIGHLATQNGESFSLMQLYTTSKQYTRITDRFSYRHIPPTQADKNHSDLRKCGYGMTQLDLSYPKLDGLQLYTRTWRN